MTVKLSQLVKREQSAEQDKKDGYTPAAMGELHLNDEAASLRVWQLMRYTEWRWLPDEILRQPEWLLDDLITIEHQYGLIKASLAK